MNRNQRYLIKKNLFCPTRKCGWDEDIADFIKCTFRKSDMFLKVPKSVVFKRKSSEKGILKSEQTNFSEKYPDFSENRGH